MGSSDISDIIKLVITSISIIDFLIFCSLFLSFMIAIPFKTEKASSKIIASSIVIIFIVYKCMYIPVFFSSITFFNFNIPGSYIMLGILTWVNVIITGMTLLFAIVTVFCYSSIKNEDLKFYSYFKVNIIMPIYNENPESLWKAINSVINLNYDKKLINLYLAFDEGVSNKLNSDAFISLMERFKLDPYDKRNRINIEINGLLIFICRFDHGSKKSAQHGAFKEIKKDNLNSLFSLNESLLFLIDSDIILNKDSLSHFTCYLKKYNKSGLTGLISCIVSENPTFLSFYQDIEYLTGQIFWRNVESYFLSTTCLPGAFTILKYSFFKKVSDMYFNSNNYKDDMDYHRFYLGEDRYLTHLLMEIEPYQLGFCQTARCKTDAPITFMSLMKQRKRWYLGHISNDAWMISSLKMWKIYPILSLFNFLNNARNTSIYIYLFYFVLLLNKEVSIELWLLFIILPILLNWLFIIIYVFKYRRKMNIVFYLCLFILQPIFNMIYMYYTIYMMREKSWGGDRVTTRKRESYINLINNNLDIEIEKADIDKDFIINILNNNTTKRNSKRNSKIHNRLSFLESEKDIKH
jgi:chitin synthase